MDTNKIDKINIDLITPTTDSNQLESQRDRWGNIHKTLTDGISDFTGLRVNISFENCNLLIKI